LASATTSSGPALQRHATIDLKNGTRLIVDISPFQQTQHKIEWCTRSDSYRHVCLIDGRPYFGTDGTVPVTQLDKIVFVHAKHNVQLDVSCMFNPWVGSPNVSLFSADSSDDGYIVRGGFADGAGAYVAAWQVVGGGSVRTSLEWAEESGPP
jgi:hypothetical protein